MNHWKLVAMLFAVFATQPALDAAQPVKDFTLPSATDGSLIRLSDRAGKVVLINWWRTSCGWSQRESPKLAALYGKYRAQGLVIIGVSDDTADTVGEVPAYLKRYGITWPVGLNDQGEFMRDIRPHGKGDTPGNYLVSRNGQFAYLGLDRSPEAWQKLERAVAQAVGEPPPGTPPPSQAPLVAPSFSLPNLKGEQVSLASFAGKPLVVNFFNSKSCGWAGPVLSKLHTDYAGRGLQVIGIDLFDKDAGIQKCVSKYAVKYPVLRGDSATQKAWLGSSKNWATFFVTADGKIIKRVLDSVENGLESTVFPKYAEFMLAKR